MEIPEPKPGHWNRISVVAKKPNILTKDKSKFIRIPNKVTCASAGQKSRPQPRCFIKISGSRYSGSFLVSVDPAVDNAIYKSMVDIEAGLGRQSKQKPLSASPKNCLSSVFKCFNQSTNLQDFKSKYTLGHQKKLKGHAIKNKAESESQPDVSGRLPRDLKPVEANNDVDETYEYKPTLSNLNKKEMTEMIFLPILNHVERSNTPTVEISNHNQSQKMAYLRSSEDEIPMFKPPKPPCDEGFEDEIRLGLKPNASAKDVSHSIKLANGKIKIGLQDGNIQIDKPIQKRPLQMIVEGDGDGKSSLRLTVHNVNNEDTNKKEEQESNNRAFSPLSQQKADDHLVIMKNNSETINASNNEKAYKRKIEQKNHADTAVEALEGFDYCPCEQENNSEQNQNGESELGVCHHRCSCSILNNSCRCCSRKPLNNCCNSLITSSRQSHINVSQRDNNKLHGRSSILKFARVPEVGTKMNRTPYMVHKLHEPHTSSVFVSAENNEYSRAKVLNGAFYKLIDNHIISAPINGRLKKKCFDSFSHFQAENEDPKLNEQFIGTNHQGDSSRKDFGVTNSTVEDFEKLLQSICGPNYGHHKSETSNMEKKRACKGRTLSFDQWSQTENLHDNIMAESRSQISFVNLLRKRSLMNMGISHANFNSISNTPPRINRAVSSYTQSDISFKNGTGTLMSEKSLKPRNRSPVLDIARNGFLNKHKSCRNYERFPGERTLCCCREKFRTGSTARNQLVNEDELKGGIINCTDTPQLDKQFYLERSGIAVSETESGENSSDNSIDECISSERQMGFINMALCSTLPGDEPNRKLDRTVVGKTYNRLPEAVPNNRCFRPIKSRSCQNIFLSRTLNLNPGIFANPTPRKTKKPRYPHLTLAESSGEQAEGLNYGLSSTKQQWRLGERIEKESSWRFHNLPPGSGCLFLRQPILPGNTMGYHWSEIGGDPSAHRISCAPNQANLPSQSVISYGVGVSFKPSSIFRRTITAIKHAFGKKIENLFRKKTITEPLTRGVNRFTLNKHDKIIFIPVPLKKKNENIQLFKDRNSKYFPF